MGCCMGSWRRGWEARAHRCLASDPGPPVSPLGVLRIPRREEARVRRKASRLNTTMISFGEGEVHSGPESMEGWRMDGTRYQCLTV